MIDVATLEAMLAAGASAEVIVAAVKSDIVRAQQKREANRNRMRAVRERARTNANVSAQSRTTPSPSPPPFPPSPITPSPLPPSTSSSPCSLRSPAIDDWPTDYKDQFWQQYPRKIGRKAAFSKLETIRKSGEVSFAKLMLGVARMPPNEPRFTPHPTTWLNRGSWDDEILTELPLNGAKNGKLTPSERAYQLAEQARKLESEAGFGRSVDAVGGDEIGGGFAKPIPQH